MRKLFFVLGLFLIFFKADFAFAIELVGVVSDSITSEQTPYNAYFRTPDFLTQDIVDSLNKNRNIRAVPLSQAKAALIKSGLSERELARLKNVQNGYSLDFVLLKKIARAIGTRYLVVVTSGIDTQRDFLKPTLWNSLSVPGFDTVNPTQKVSVYAVLVDTNRESVLWEDIFAKNIRNNKMKNLDTTIAGNYEGMMRIKQYSKYISPEISSAVIAKVAPMSFSPQQYGSQLEHVVMGVNHKMRIGSQKNLSNIDYIADGFDVFDEKVAQTKENINRKKEETKNKYAQWKADRAKRAQALKKQRAAERELKEAQKFLNVNSLKNENAVESNVKLRGAEYTIENKVQLREGLDYSAPRAMQALQELQERGTAPATLKLKSKKNINELNESPWFVF